MHYCTSHMHALRDKLRHIGLWYLVNTNPAVVKDRAQKWMKGTALREEFDPLVVIMLEINAKTKLHSVYVLPGGCPLCAVNAAKLDHTLADKWIEGFADLAMQIAQKNHLPTRMVQ